METHEIPTIGEEEKFYGYITGLGIERCTEPLSPNPAGLTRFYATFEHHGKTSVWLVPDPALFELLSEHLCSMVRARWASGDDYGYDKLWISKKNGAWNVDLP